MTKKSLAKFHRQFFTSIDSTQIYAENHEAELQYYTVGEWRVILADQQTQGQGTHGRLWDSPSGNIYATFSTLAPVSDFKLKDIPHVVVVAIMHVLTSFGVEPQYKWVNDVLLNEKKVAGILCRTGKHQINGNKIFHIGIGINIVLSEQACQSFSQPVTSLNLILGKSVDREIVVNRLQESLANHFECYLHSGRLFMQKELNHRLAFKHQSIVFSLENNTGKVIEGILKGIGEEGQIIIENQASGEIEAYFSGRILRAC